MPPRPTQRRDTSGSVVGKARRNYAALAAALLEAMAHQRTVEVTLRTDSGGSRKVTGRVTRWTQDEQMALAVSKLPVKDRRGHPTMVFVIGGERVRLNSISNAKRVTS